MNLAERVDRLLSGVGPSVVHFAGLEPRADLPFTSIRSRGASRAWADLLADEDTITYGEVRP